MNEHKEISSISNINSEWTLFLDRDGVINRRLPGDYVRDIDQFEFLPGVLESIAFFRTRFSRIIVVTNQQGVGKGLMDLKDLNQIHEYMVTQINTAGAHIDAVFFCPDLHSQPINCRKPNPQMAHAAKSQFPEIQFEKSLMVGDSISDLQFGQGLGMTTVYIRYPDSTAYPCDLECGSLIELARLLQ